MPLSDGVLVALINSIALIWVGAMQYRQRSTKTTRARQEAMEEGMKAILKGELAVIHRTCVESADPPPIPQSVMDEAD